MGSETIGGIIRSGSPGSYVYSVKTDAIGEGPGGSNYTYAEKPVTFVSWGDAARFANWLHNGQPTGPQDANTTEDGAYLLNGATTGGALSIVTRKSGARWSLPTEDEWYKAAYYNGDQAIYRDYPTGFNATPNNNLPTSDTGNSANFYEHGPTTGSHSYPMTDAGAYVLSASYYGTHDQGGNVFEWNETMIAGAKRSIRGGSFLNYSGNFDSSFTLHAKERPSRDPTVPGIDIGFRVATIPEPTTAILATIGLVVLAAFGWRRCWTM